MVWAATAAEVAIVELGTAAVLSVETGVGTPGVAVVGWAAATVALADRT